MKNNRTETQLIIEAYQVQDACNLSGVVHSFSRAISDLREACPNQGTEFYNQHPVSILYASKISSLAGAGFNAESEAFRLGRECSEAA